MSTSTRWTTEEIRLRSRTDPAFRDGLLAAAAVCKAQGQGWTESPCPSGVAAVYLERLAAGEAP